MNKKRPTAGLFDGQHKVAKLAKLNDVLIRLKAQVDWDGFRPVVEEAFPQRDPRKGGQPPYDRLMLFKMLVLCRLYHLSAEALSGLLGLGAPARSARCHHRTPVR